MGGNIFDNAGDATSWSDMGRATEAVHKSCATQNTAETVVHNSCAPTHTTEDGWGAVQTWTRWTRFTGFELGFTQRNGEHRV